MITETLVEVTGLRKSFGTTQVLRGVDLQVAAGEVVAILGGNGAGKSTLLRCIAGLLPADPLAGEVRVTGSRVTSYAVARALGVESIHQERSLIPAWRVREHFATNPCPVRRELLPEVDAHRLVESLDERQLQLLEVAKALDSFARVVLADEPAAGLSTTDATKVWSALRRHTGPERSVLVITHRLADALAFADRAVVLQGGRVVIDESCATLSMSRVLEAMLTSTDSRPSMLPTAAGDRPITFSLKPDSIPALMEIQATEVVGIVAGAHHRSVLRQLYDSHSSSISMRYVSRDRAREWDFPDQSVEFNLTVGILPRLGRWGWIDAGKSRREAEALAAAFSVHPADPASKIQNLSGGNRQKVVVARAAAARPRLLLLDEPFSGVDAGTRHAIVAKLRSLAAEEMAVLVLTDETAEVYQSLDRVIAISPMGVIRQFSTRAHSFETVDHFALGTSV